MTTDDPRTPEEQQLHDRQGRAACKHLKEVNARDEQTYPGHRLTTTDEGLTFACSCGAKIETPPPKLRWLTRDECERTSRLPEEVIAALPEITRYQYPQPCPQEYDCGCVGILRVTSRYGDDQQPFELCLAVPCDKDLAACELAELRRKVSAPKPVGVIAARKITGSGTIDPSILVIVNEANDAGPE